MIGRIGSSRTYRTIYRRYVQQNEYINKYKVFLPEANGSGAIGEVIPTPLIGEPTIGKPGMGTTDTFLCVGKYDNEIEATATMKYLKTRFARALLGVKKVTQHNPKATWSLVPLQDFSSSSDIDWSKSIPEIDQQLYKKYGLDDAEIDFIESHIKEMC